MDGYVYDIRDDLGGSYRRMVMVVPGHVTDGDGGAGIGHARSAQLYWNNRFGTVRCRRAERSVLCTSAGIWRRDYVAGWI